ncbi:hypothetical protein D3C73_1167120 [compost metagenome]
MSKYDRLIIGRDADGKAVVVTVDVYRVLEAFGVTSAPLQHLVKKALCAGLRGHKDRTQDLSDILLSAQKAVDMAKDEEALAPRAPVAPR